jgi:hypothetical protein
MEIALNIDYIKLLESFSWAQAVYGVGADRTPLAVGNSRPIDVRDFTATPGSGFNGALYHDPTTGRYVIAYAGTADLRAA